MVRYLVLFQWADAAADHAAVLAELRKQSSWCEPFLGAWIIESGATASQFANAIGALLDPGDQFAMIPVRSPNPPDFVLSPENVALIERFWR